MKPAWQSKQVADPEFSCDFPEGHGLQAPSFGNAMCHPIGHFLHAKFASPAAYLPSTQGEHLMLSVLFVAKPIGHT